MKWLTPEKVEAYATTPCKALAISIKAWRQKATCTREELSDVIDRDLEFFGTLLCGLCCYWDNCDECPCTECSSGFYGKVLDAFDAFFENRTSRNFKNWHLWTGRMYEYLCSLRK